MLSGKTDNRCRAFPYRATQSKPAALHAPPARLGAREASPPLPAAIARRRCYEPATITSSFRTDVTPGTSAATRAACSRCARESAVPYKVTTPLEEPASIASSFSRGSDPSADFTLAAKALSSSTFAACAGLAAATGLIGSVFSSVGLGASCTWDTGPVSFSLFHSDAIWSHATNPIASTLAPKAG